MRIIKKNGVTIVIVIAALFASASVLYSVEDMIILPKTGHRKPPVTFSHAAHSKNYSTKCTDCHHIGENTKCSSCHLRRDQGAVINLKAAFHQQCVACHRKVSGPLGCSRCHTRTKQ